MAIYPNFKKNYHLTYYITLNCHLHLKEGPDTHKTQYSFETIRLM